MKLEYSFTEKKCNKNYICIIKPKFYKKTLEEVTSWGVNYDKTCETFNRMLVTKNKFSGPKEMKEVR